MGKSAQSVVAAAAAVVVLLAGAVLVDRAADDDPTAAVLGRQVVRGSTTTQLAATTTSVSPASTTTLAPIAAGETTTSVVPPTTLRPTTTTTATPSGQVVERADVTSEFDYRPDGGGAMSTTGSSPPRDTFVFKTLGSDVDRDGIAELRSEMTNQTAREITFPDGLVLRFMLTRDGQQWRTVELRFPDTRSLPAGGSLEVESATPLQQQYGRFQVTGEVPVDYR